MINRDERCVYVADNLKNAEAVIQYLEEQRVGARVGSPTGRDGEYGLTPLPGTESPSGEIEIWVHDVALVKLACRLLEEYQEEPAEKRDQNGRLIGPVLVECETCYRESLFPASQLGTMQVCPVCLSFLDVPGADEDAWDVGDDEEDEQGPNENITAR